MVYALELSIFQRNIHGTLFILGIFDVNNGKITRCYRDKFEEISIFLHPNNGRD
jgi:limonene-1,2-epoxide hydrolase